MDVFEMNTEKKGGLQLTSARSDQCVTLAKPDHLVSFKSKPFINLCL